MYILSVFICYPSFFFPSSTRRIVQFCLLGLNNFRPFHFVHRVISQLCSIINFFFFLCTFVTMKDACGYACGRFSLFSTCNFLSPGADDSLSGANRKKNCYFMYIYPFDNVQSFSLTEHSSRNIARPNRCQFFFFFSSLFVYNFNYKSVSNI